MLRERRNSHSSGTTALQNKRAPTVSCGLGGRGPANCCDVGSCVRQMEFAQDIPMGKCWKCWRVKCFLGKERFAFPFTNELLKVDLENVLGFFHCFGTFVVTAMVLKLHSHLFLSF